MSDGASEGTRPRPRVAFGHPAAARPDLESADEQAGHDESPPPAEAEAYGGPELAILPPRGVGEVSRESLAARIRRGSGAGRAP